MNSEQGRLNTVDVFDYSGANLNCENPHNLPYPITGGVLMATPGKKPWYCGGFGLKTGAQTTASLAECLEFDPDTNSWSTAATMNTPRRRPAGIVINSETVWLTGGRSGDTGAVASTEYYQSTTFNPGPALPNALHRHCMARVDADTVIIVGGATDAGVAQNAIHLFDIPSQTFTSPNNPMTQARIGVTCQVQIT